MRAHNVNENVLHRKQILIELLEYDTVTLKQLGKAIQNTPLPTP